MKPKDCRYAETHEWAKTGKDEKEVTVGITDFAVSQLSDLVHVELPKVGDKVEQGSSFGEIESVKTVADLLAPVTGKISAVNGDVAESPEGITADPFGEGWLVKITANDTKELDSLMSASEYETFLKAASEEEEDDGDESDDDDFM